MGPTWGPPGSCQLSGYVSIPGLSLIITQQYLKITIVLHCIVQVSCIKHCWFLPKHTPSSYSAVWNSVQYGIILWRDLLLSTFPVYHNLVMSCQLGRCYARNHLWVLCQKPSVTLMGKTGMGSSAGVIQSLWSQKICWSDFQRWFIIHLWSVVETIGKNVFRFEFDWKKWDCVSSVAQKI